jgi:hypothetical protein
MKAEYAFPCFLFSITLYLKNRDKSVGIATTIFVGRLRIRGSVADRCRRILYAIGSQSGLHGPPRVHSDLQGVHVNERKNWGCMRCE